MKVLTEKFADKVRKYLEEERANFQDEDIDNALDSLNNSVGSKISSFNLTMITRMIDDDELLKQLDKLEEKEERGNLFS